MLFCFLPEVLLMVHSEALDMVNLPSHSPVSQPFPRSSGWFAEYDSITCYGFEISCSNMFFTGSYESTWIYQSNITFSNCWFTKTSVTWFNFSWVFCRWSLHLAVPKPIRGKKSFSPSPPTKLRFTEPRMSPGTSGRWAAGASGGGN